VILESDAANLVQGLTGYSLDRSEIGVMLSEIREKMHSNCTCCRIYLCPRSCNSVADCLAASGMNSGDGENSIWLDRPPEFVTTLVSGEMPESWSLMESSVPLKEKGPCG
jgi:hypothetical protein